MKLRVEKTKEYVWRYDWCGSHFGYIPCYWVYQGDKLIAGSVSSGSNVRSGHARFSRLRDAKAFVAGYTDATNGLEKSGRKYVEENNIGKKYKFGNAVNCIFDNEASDNYDSGQYAVLGHVTR